jgi:hypothetical protein
MSPVFSGPAPALTWSGTNATPYGFTSPFIGTVDILRTGLGRNASSASKDCATTIPAVPPISAPTIAALCQPRDTTSLSSSISHLPGEIPAPGCTDPSLQQAEASLAV